MEKWDEEKPGLAFIACGANTTKNRGMERNVDMERKEDKRQYSEDRYRDLIWVHGYLYRVNEKGNGLTALKDGSEDNFHALVKSEEGYSGMFNTVTRKFMPFDKRILCEEGDWKGVSFPSQTLKSHYLLRVVDKMRLNTALKKWECGFRLMEPQMEARLNGALSRVFVDGKSYVMDIPGLEIRNRFSPLLRFSFPPDALHSNTHVLYNWQEKLPVQVTSVAKKYGPEICCLEFSPLKQVDMLDHYRDTLTGIHWNDILLHPDPPKASVKTLTAERLSAAISDAGKAKNWHYSKRKNRGLGL